MSQTNQATLDLLGLTQSELQERVIDRLCNELLTAQLADDEGELHRQESSLQQVMRAEIKKQIDAAVTAIGERIIKPRVEEMINSVVIQKTNTYGEKKGQPATFVEYITSLAETYMLETVDADGKVVPDPKNRGFGQAYHQTRAMYLVGTFLGKHVSEAVTEFVKDGNKQILGGLEEAVKAKLREIEVTAVVKTK